MHNRQDRGSSPAPSDRTHDEGSGSELTRAQIVRAAERSASQTAAEGWTWQRDPHEQEPARPDPRAEAGNAFLWALSWAHLVVK